MSMSICCFFFFNDTATTEIYTLSLHDALPIYRPRVGPAAARGKLRAADQPAGGGDERARRRSEEHTSELQSLAYLVCRLLLEKKKQSIVSVSEGYTQYAHASPAQRYASPRCSS